MSPGLLLPDPVMMTASATTLAAPTLPCDDEFLFCFFIVFEYYLFINNEATTHTIFKSGRPSTGLETHVFFSFIFLTLLVFLCRYVY